jgi:phenylpyruvate tautomerase PptA (4-oxalocrotonate tautomerase family)
MIALTTSAHITPADETALRAGFGRAIELLPGKSETHLMISFTGDTPMAFQGEKRDAAYLEVSCFGHVAPEAYAKMTGAVCALVCETLHIDTANTYVKYTETTNWGWAGRNF